MVWFVAVETTRELWWTRDLKTVRDHLMPRSSICIMDLPALWTIPFFAREWARPPACRRVHVGTEMD